MILHYLKIALRNLLKYRTQSAISVLGLVIGLAFFTFGFHWLKYVVLRHHHPHGIAQSIPPSDAGSQ